jgi:hypothetical protein
MGPTQPPVQWVAGFFQGVKRPTREADHSPPPDIEVKNQLRDTSAPRTHIHGADRDSFTFYVCLL